MSEQRNGQTLGKERYRKRGNLATIRRNVAVLCMTAIAAASSAPIASADGIGKDSCREKVRHGVVIPCVPEGLHIRAAQQSGTSYSNPFVAIQGYKPNRIDMGVDEDGTGELKTFAPCDVTGFEDKTSKFWGNDGGSYIAVKVDQGVAKNWTFYYAEYLHPDRGLYVGEHLRAGQNIGYMYAPIEMGIARGDGSGVPLAWNAYSQVHDGTVTNTGLAMSRLLMDYAHAQGGNQSLSYNPGYVLDAADGIPQW